MDIPSYMKPKVILPQVLSIDEQVDLYLKTSGDKKINGGAPKRYFELVKLKWFWKNLGLTKFDLQKCHPDWVSEIYLTGLGIEKFESNKLQGKMGAGSVVERPTAKGKLRIQKLL